MPHCAHLGLDVDVKLSRGKIFKMQEKPYHQPLPAALGEIVSITRPYDRKLSLYLMFLGPASKTCPTTSGRLGRLVVLESWVRHRSCRIMAAEIGYWVIGVSGVRRPRFGVGEHTRDKHGDGRFVVAGYFTRGQRQARGQVAHRLLVQGPHTTRTAPKMKAWDNYVTSGTKYHLNFEKLVQLS